MTSFLQQLKDLQDNSEYQYLRLHSNQYLASNQKEQQQNQRIKLNLYDTQQYQQNSVIYKDSYIEYVPFQRRYLDYQQRVYKQIIPRKRVQQFSVERVITEQIPFQIRETDYYAIQHVRYYLKQIIPQRKIQYVPVFKNITKLQYIPVERKIVHYPKDVKTNDIVDYEQRPIRQINQVNKQIDSSPVKKYMIESVQKPQLVQPYEQSVLTSLTKAYSRQCQQSTVFNNNKVNKQCNQNIPLRKSSLQKPQFVSFNKMNYRSVESITVPNISNQYNKNIKITRFK